MVEGMGRVGRPGGATAVIRGRVGDGRNFVAAVRRLTILP